MTKKLTTRRAALGAVLAVTGCGGRSARPTRTETTAPNDSTPSLRPRGPVPPAGGIVETTLERGVLTLRTTRYDDSTDPGWAAVEVDLLTDSTAETNPVSISEQMVRRYPPLQNALAYAGYRPSLLITETNNDYARPLINSLYSLWDRRRGPDTDRRFRFGDYRFELRATAAP